jgi:hypothetical protein
MGEHSMSVPLFVCLDLGRRDVKTPRLKSKTKDREDFLSLTVSQSLSPWLGLC